MKFAQPMLLAVSIAVAGGCGQKGPLVLPDAQKHKRTIPSLPGAAAKPASGVTPPAPAAGTATGPAPPAPAPASPGTTPTPPTPQS